jgi:hypothetical protein
VQARRCLGELWRARYWGTQTSACCTTGAQQGSIVSEQRACRRGSKLSEEVQNLFGSPAAQRFLITVPAGRWETFAGH